MAAHPATATAKLPDEIVGSRVLLRPWRLSDAPALFEAIDRSRARLRPWMDWVDDHRTLGDSEDYCRRVAINWAERSDLALGIWHRESGRLLGGTGFHNIRWSVPCFEVGYWIRDGEVGQGYVEEAVRLQAGYAFHELGANRLALTCDANNERSRRIPERIGFVLEGRMRNETRTQAGGLRDTLIFSLVPGDPAVEEIARPR